MHSTRPEQLPSGPTLSVTSEWRSSLLPRLRATATHLVAAGWPIVAVSHPDAEQVVVDRCVPDAGTAADWWADEPYGIACRTGALFDAVEVPSWLGPLVLPAVEHCATVVEIVRPLAATWLFLVTPGSPRIPDLPRDAHARLLGSGDLVVLPPSIVLGGSTRWVARPRPLDDLRLPHSLALQWAVVRAVVAARHRAAARHVGGASGRRAADGERATTSPT